MVRLLGCRFGRCVADAVVSLAPPDPGDVLREDRPGFVFSALQSGADGVLLAGCHPGDCHYSEGNYLCLRRTLMMKKLLEQFGVDEDRLRLEWISASEGEKYSRVSWEMEDRIREMGPLELQQ